jgi:hypothetical protein
MPCSPPREVRVPAPARVTLGQARRLITEVPQLWVPITSSTSSDQVIFVDHATDVSLSSDAVEVEVGRLG